MRKVKAQQGIFTQPKAAWLEEARATARHLLQEREWITAESVVALCPLPRYLHRNSIGGIFQHSDFQVMGYTFAKRPSSNGRMIRKWGLRNPPEPRKWKTPVEADSGD